MPTYTIENFTVAPGKVEKVSLLAGETSNPVYTPAECTITCVPGGGGTMLAQATYSLPSEVAAGTATWFDWDSGPIGVPTLQYLLHATAVRFTATTVAGSGGVSS